VAAEAEPEAAASLLSAVAQRRSAAQPSSPLRACIHPSIRSTDHGGGGRKENFEQRRTEQTKNKQNKKKRKIRLGGAETPQCNQTERKQKEACGTTERNQENKVHGNKRMQMWKPIHLIGSELTQMLLEIDAFLNEALKAS
jgi:hypothetical protein